MRQKPGRDQFFRNSVKFVILTVILCVLQRLSGCVNVFWPSGVVVLLKTVGTGELDPVF